MSTIVQNYIPINVPLVVAVFTNTVLYKYI